MVSSYELHLIKAKGTLVSNFHRNTQLSCARLTGPSSLSRSSSTRCVCHFEARSCMAQQIHAGRCIAPATDRLAKVALSSQCHPSVTALAIRPAYAHCTSIAFTAGSSSGVQGSCCSSAHTLRGKAKTLTIPRMVSPRIHGEELPVIATNTTDGWRLRALYLPMDIQQLHWVELRH